MVRSVLKYGSAKAKFTANATYHQTLVVQAAQAVKVVVRKVQQHLAVVATKEAANVVVNAEAMIEAGGDRRGGPGGGDRRARWRR